MSGGVSFGLTFALAGYNVFAVQQVQRCPVSGPLPGPQHIVLQLPLGLIWVLGNLPHFGLMLFLTLASATVPPLMVLAVAYFSVWYLMLPGMLIEFSRSRRFRDLLNLGKAFRLLRSAPVLYLQMTLIPLCCYAPGIAASWSGAADSWLVAFQGLGSWLAFSSSVLLERAFARRMDQPELPDEHHVGLNPTPGEQAPAPPGSHPRAAG